MKISDFSFQISKIYPITNAQLTDLTHVEQVRRLCEGGATFIQLRDKHASPKDFYEQAKEAVEFANRKNIKIIINDRVDIALALEADGVHLGQDDLPPEKARKILGDKAIIGFSTHTLKQAEKAAQLPIDYLAIGPVFNTQTKKNPERIVGIEMIEKVRKAIGNLPLVAIGGVNLTNLHDVLEAGADSAAIIGGLLSEPDKISEKMSEFMSYKN